MNFLQIEYIDYHSYYSLPCPIHGSNKQDSISIYKNTGLWYCWTGGCQEEIGKGFFNFLSGYFNSIGQTKTMGQIALFCAGVLNADITNLGEIEDYDVKLDSMKIVNNLIKQRKVLAGKILRKSIREKLYIPARYYIDRGYKPDTLDRYDVGLCKTQGKEMFGRIVVPVYDDDYKFMVGCLGRNSNPKCEKCNKYHFSGRKCPETSMESLWSSKWKNSKNFKIDSYFYNYWFSKPWIEKNKTIIIVEGQGDVWRLEEAGINCSVGVFGSKITDGQRLLLEQCGAQNIIIAPDNDEAGDHFRKQVHSMCERMFNVHDVFLTKNDFGEMSIEETKQAVLPVLERCF